VVRFRVEPWVGRDLDGTAAAAQVLTFSEGLAIGGAFHVGVEADFSQWREAETFRSRPERFRDVYRSERHFFVIGDHYYSNGSNSIIFVCYNHLV